jgi:hypothetical protein
MIRHHYERAEEAATSHPTSRAFMKLSPEECRRLNRERCTFKRGVRLQLGIRERAFTREPYAKERGTTENVAPSNKALLRGDGVRTLVDDDSRGNRQWGASEYRR